MSFILYNKNQEFFVEIKINNFYYASMNLIKQKHSLNKFFKIFIYFCFLSKSFSYNKIVQNIEFRVFYKHL